MAQRTAPAANPTTNELLAEIDRLADRVDALIEARTRQLRESR